MNTLRNWRGWRWYWIECWECDTVRGWEYDGPPDSAIDYDAPTAQEQHEKAWRQKQHLKGRRGFHYEE